MSEVRTPAREQILSAVRRVTGAGSEPARAPNVIPARGADDAAVVSRFMAESERAGSDVRLVSGVDEIPAVISAYLRDHNLGGQIRVSSDPLAEAIPWPDDPMISAAAGPAEPDDTASLSVALSGIAETGTLMIASSPENPAMLNYLPFVHVGVIPEGVVGLTWPKSRSYFPAFSARAKMVTMASSRWRSRMAMASSRVIGQFPPEVPMQGIKIDRFGSTMMVVAIASLGAAFGQTHIDPVGSLIAGTLETAQIHKGLSEVKGMTINRLPIMT